MGSRKVAKQATPRTTKAQIHTLLSKMFDFPMLEIEPSGQDDDAYGISAGAGGDIWCDRLDLGLYLCVRARACVRV